MPTGDSIVTWGEPEQAPHIHDVQEFCLCLSVHTFIIQQFTNVVLIYGVSLIDDCSFINTFSALFLYKQSCHDKQTQQTGY